MAPNDRSFQMVALRALNHRLTSTPAEKLPRVVPYLTSQLASCRDIGTIVQTKGSKADQELPTLIHKLKTRISSLFQERAPESRWAGVVLAKTVLECNICSLQECLPWVRSLLTNLAKDDPPTTKKLSIITLTRIFVLTRGSQSLVREITTPNLPAFVAAGIQLAKSTRQLADTIFGCFSQLIGRHPTIFRSYIGQLRPLLLAHIVQQDDFHLGSSVQDSARELFVQLHECAPKNASAAEWQASFRQAVICTHEDVDQVFRSVLEEWESTAGYRPIQQDVQVLSIAPSRPEADAVGLKPWTGIIEGAQRIVDLLQLIRTYLDTSTTFTIDLSIGALIDLLSRLSSMTRPSSVRDWETSGKADIRFESNEREELASVLPNIHVALAQLVTTLIARLDQSSAAIVATLLDHLLWPFEAEFSSSDLRCAVYEAMNLLLSRWGIGLDKRQVQTLQPIAVACCQDLTPTKPAADLASYGLDGRQNAELSTVLDSANSSHHDALADAAYRLLPILLGHLRADLIARPMRSQLERTAVLCRHKSALIASVENPSTHHQSLLPFLARLFPHDREVLVLVKPRMPVILQAPADTRKEMEEDEESEAGLPPLNGASVGRLYQAAYAGLDDEYSSNRTGVDHLFPIDWTTKDQETFVRESAPQAEPSGDEEAEPAAELEVDIPHETRKRQQPSPGLQEQPKRPRFEGDAPKQPTAVTESDLEGAQWGVEDATTLYPTRSELREQLAHGPPLPQPGPAERPTGALAKEEEEEGKQEEDDEEDFEMPELHFRSASDDDGDDDGGD